MIAQALRVHETSVVRFIDDYLDSEKLTIESGDSDNHLTNEQTQELILHLCDVTYQLSGFNKWLHRHNFSDKKPKGVPYQFDKEKLPSLLRATRS